MEAHLAAQEGSIAADAAAGRAAAAYGWMGLRIKNADRMRPRVLASSVLKTLTVEGGVLAATLLGEVRAEISSVWEGV